MQLNGNHFVLAYEPVANATEREPRCPCLRTLRTSCQRHLRLLAVANQTSLVGLGKRRCLHLPSLMPCGASYYTCEPPLHPRRRQPGTALPSWLNNQGFFSWLNNQGFFSWLNNQGMEL